MEEQPYVYWHPDYIDKYFINMYGVIHVGAHYGQEYNDYIKKGIRDILFIEPLESNYKRLLELLPPNPYVKTLKMAIGNVTGEVDMYVETANMGQSSSILEPETHLSTYPFITFDTVERVKINKLDNVEFDRSLYNVMNVDVQGYELEVFRGATKTLKTIDVVFTEINTGEVYKHCGKLGDIDLILSQNGFSRAWIHEYDSIYYGDAIYIKRTFE